jgi:hypothetical protein
VALLEIGVVRTGFWWGDLRESDHLEDLGLGRWIILKCIFQKLDKDMDWIDLAHNRDRRRVVVNAVMNFVFLKMRGNFLTS